MAIVYQATNLINGKRYIGVTKRSLEKRIIGHHSNANKGLQQVFSRAIRKYGRAAFEWRTLHDYLFIKDAIDAEARFVEKLRPEYNMTAGGLGIPGLSHTDKTKAKLRELGLRDRDKWAQRSHLGPKAFSRPVVCLDDGKEYESASAAGRAYGVAKSTIIELCLGKNGRETAGGHRFQYVGHPPPQKTAASRKKLTMEKADEIRALRGKMSLVKIGKAFGVCGSTIGDIFHGRIWRKK